MFSLKVYITNINKNKNIRYGKNTNQYYGNLIKENYDW